jgi:hypothetical protein
MVILRLEVENVSNAHIEVLSKRLQIIQREEEKDFNEWVPLSESVGDKGNPRSPGLLEPWKDPIEVLTTTKNILPQERIVVERLQNCPKGRVLHVAFQIQRKPPPKWLDELQKELSRSWFTSWPSAARSWTTTVVVARENPQAPQSQGATERG